MNSAGDFDLLVLIPGIDLLSLVTCAGVPLPGKARSIRTGGCNSNSSDRRHTHAGRQGPHHSYWVVGEQVEVLVCVVIYWG